MEIRNAIGVVLCGAAGLVMARYCSLAFMAWTCIGLALGWTVLLLWPSRYSLRSEESYNGPPPVGQVPDPPPPPPPMHAAYCHYEVDQFLERLK